MAYQQRRKRRRKQESGLLDLMVAASLAAPWWLNLALGAGSFGFWKWGIALWIDHVFYNALAMTAAMLVMVLCTPMGIYQFIQQPTRSRPTSTPTPRTIVIPNNAPKTPSTSKSSSLDTLPITDDPASSAQRLQDYQDGVSRAGQLSAAQRPASPTPAPIYDMSKAEVLMDKGRVYVPHGLFFTPSERVAYAELVKTHAESAIVFSKVRVVDVIKPDTFKHPKWTKNFTTLFRQLSQWHLDFVIVDSASMKVIRAIELDDPTHFRPDRVRRDRILNAAFANAGVPLDRMHLRAGKLHLLHQQQRKAGTTLENGVRHW